MTLCPQRTQPALRTSQWAVFPSSLCQSTHPLPWGHRQQHPHQEGLGNAQPGACWWRMVAMVSKKKGQLEPGMRNMSRAAWGARAGAGGPGRVGGDREVWQRGRQGAHSSPFCPPHASFISPLHAHLHPRCGLAGCGTGVPAALTAQCRAPGAVPSLPVSACTGSRALL